MALKEVLEANKVPLPPDFDERFNLVIMGLRKDPKFDEELKKFKEQSGGLKLSGMSNKFKSGISSAKNRLNSGVSSAKNRLNSGVSSAKGFLSSATDSIPATSDTSASLAPPLELDSEDWMGPRIRWFLDTVTSPYARVMLRGLFMVIFFISYLEAIPTFGSILSSALDLMVAGSKALTKTIQKQIPPLMGLIPIPYASLIGIILAAIYGATVWPMIAMVAFSRQDFTAAIESFLRAIPPPAGDTIADLFLEGNRVIARLDAKRRKLANDIIVAIGTIANIIEGISDKINEGVSKVNAQIEKASKMKDKAIADVKENVNQAKKQLKDDTISTIKEIVDVTREPKEDTNKKVNQEPVKTKEDTLTKTDTEVKDKGVSTKPSLQDVFSDLKKTTPTTKQISTSMRDLSSKIKESAKPRASFEPTPVGQGRKRLSTRRRGSSKWMKTQRTRSVKH